MHIETGAAAAARRKSAIAVTRHTRNFGVANVNWARAAVPAPLSVSGETYTTFLLRLGSQNLIV